MSKIKQFIDRVIFKKTYPFINIDKKGKFVDFWEHVGELNAINADLFNNIVVKCNQIVREVEELKTKQ